MQIFRTRASLETGPRGPRRRGPRRLWRRFPRTRRLGARRIAQGRRGRHARAPGLGGHAAGQVLFRRVRADAVKAYYAHPTAWSEIGFGGPASPRGYVRMDFDRRDPWEAAEAEPDARPRLHREPAHRSLRTGQIMRLSGTGNAADNRVAARRAMTRCTPPAPVTAVRPT